VTGAGCFAFTTPWPSASARPQRQHCAAARAVANRGQIWLATAAQTLQTTKPAAGACLLLVCPVKEKVHCIKNLHGTAGALDGTCLLRRAAGSTMPLYSSAFFLQHSSVPAGIDTATVLHPHMTVMRVRRVMIRKDHPNRACRRQPDCGAPVRTTSRTVTTRRRTSVSSVAAAHTLQCCASSQRTTSSPLYGL